MPADRAALAAALAAETAALEELVADLDAPGWATPTPASGWSVHDQISHLAYFDEAAARAARDPHRFRAERDAAISDVEDFTGSIAARHRDLAPAALRAWFRAARADMLDALLSADESARLPWYGPDMAVASMLTARIMETWAHGQDIADALGAPHDVTSALEHVAFLGVRTLPNSFSSHGLAVPAAEVRVEVAAPGGGTWEWGAPGATDRVEGDAVEFCLVVTQRRNLADTALRVAGPAATAWMRIAQAFAGPAGAGRRPGQFARRA